jgi:hypothetical protein
MENDGYFCYMNLQLYSSGRKEGYLLQATKYNVSEQGLSKIQTKSQYFSKKKRTRKVLAS